VTAFRLVAAILLALALAAPARAEAITHRIAVPPGEAVPTNGSFSIRFPIAFGDYEFTAEDSTAPTVVVRMLMGVDGEGLRFSATEMPFAGQPKPLYSFFETARNRPGASVSEVHNEQRDDVKTLSFTLTEPKSGTYVLLLRTKTVQYMQVIQFPDALPGKAAGMKDDFFSSLKITQP
jgi:hypothetical protein